jgi:hypothetical protein
MARFHELVDTADQLLNILQMQPGRRLVQDV